MAIATGAQKENLAVAYGTNATYASLHTADPGTTGASEVTATGSPAYARKATTWNAGTAGDGVVTVTVTFDVPAGTTVSHVGLWGGAGAGTIGTGTFLDKAAVTSQNFASQGTYQVTLTYTQS